MFDLMQYALIFYDFQLILAQMGTSPAPTYGSNIKPMMATARAINKAR
jgi:hypothetical protein